MGVPGVVSTGVIVSHLNRRHPMGMRVHHHGDRQCDGHTEESVAVLPPVPPPFPPSSHHTETLGTHMLPLCHYVEPASSAVCCVKLRVQFTLLESSPYQQKGKSNAFHLTIENFAWMFWLQTRRHLPFSFVKVPVTLFPSKTGI